MTHAYVDPKVLHSTVTLCDSGFPDLLPNAKPNVMEMCTFLIKMKI